MHTKVFTESETLDEIKIFNFTHIDRREGYNESVTKMYRFHAHAFRPETTRDIQRTRIIEDTNLIMIVA